MRSISHPNIVGMVGYFYSKNGKDSWLNLVLEYVPDTIFRLVKEQFKATGTGIRNADTVRKWAYGLFRALDYLHSIGICHRDIKPQNLLVEPESNTVKLCDFGSAKRLQSGEPSISYICSRFYRAPEIVLGATRYTVTIDVWSAGCVLAEIVLGRPIFAGKNTVEQLIEIVKVIGVPTLHDIAAMNLDSKEFQFPTNGLRKDQSLSKLLQSAFPIDQKGSADFLDLLQKIFVYDPKLRMSASQALQHSFFEEM